MEAIGFVDISNTGSAALAEAVLARWQADGTVPTVELYGEEIVGVARQIWKERQAAAA